MIGFADVYPWVVIGIVAWVVIGAALYRALIESHEELRKRKGSDPNGVK